MRCFGPSASLKARLRRDELTEAFGEGYDEAEEARIFALEELARQYPLPEGTWVRLPGGEVTTVNDVGSVGGRGLARASPIGTRSIG